jgi:ABC-2 type transport system ATP-binding protein
VGVELGDGDGSILVETRSPDAFYSRLATVALSKGTPIEEVYSDDDNLEAVFKYLVNP